MKRQNNKAKYKDAEYVKQDTLNYLEERYGEEFEIESVRGMSYAYDYINMYAKINNQAASSISSTNKWIRQLDPYKDNANNIID